MAAKSQIIGEHALSLLKICLHMCLFHILCYVYYQFLATAVDMFMSWTGWFCSSLRLMMEFLQTPAQYLVTDIVWT